MGSESDQTVASPCIWYSNPSRRDCSKRVLLVFTAYLRYQTGDRNPELSIKFL